MRIAKYVVQQWQRLTQRVMSRTVPVTLYSFGELYDQLGPDAPAVCTARATLQANISDQMLSQLSEQQQIMFDAFGHTEAF